MLKFLHFCWSGLERVYAIGDLYGRAAMVELNAGAAPWCGGCSCCRYREGQSGALYLATRVTICEDLSAFSEICAYMVAEEVIEEKPCYPFFGQLFWSLVYFPGVASQE